MDKLGARITAFLLRSLFNFGIVLASSFKWLAVYLAPAGSLIFKLAILPLYGRYLWLTSKLTKAAPKKGDRLLLIFTNRFFVHLLILSIGIGVAFSNLMAYESREDYGQNALVYKLAGLSDEELIEDSNVISSDTKIYNYQEQGIFVEGNSFASADNTDSDNIFTDQSTSAGDMALIKPDIVGTDVAKSTVGRISEYVVADGDTISRIATNFGVSVNTILWANNLSFSSYVKPGQKLIVPTVSGVIYKVVKNDTLSKISARYGIPSAKISEANGLSDEGLTVGTSLIIPGGKIIETARPRTVAPPAKTYTAPASQSPISLGSGVMAWPAGCRRISQYFKGWIHTGVDIACPWGTTLRAADGGRVVRVQYGRTGYGYNVIIDHGGGITTLYGHMSSIDVAVGQYVEKGQPIGAEGSTGRSTGPHLHFEVRINGAKVNPLSYIR